MRPAWLVVSVLLFAACGPTIDPAAKADLDRRLAQLPTSEETYPPSESFLPMAFNIGQWTQHRVRDDKGGAQLITSKLVGQEDGGYWLETITESYAGREIAKMHVALHTGRDPSGMEIRSLRIKRGNNAPVDVDPTELVNARAQYRHYLDLLAVSFESNLKDDARVPGGHFIGCYKSKTSKAWGPWQSSALLCSHPSVPLSGVVRAQTTDAQSLMELVSFGVRGAEPEL